VRQVDVGVDNRDTHVNRSGNTVGPYSATPLGLHPVHAGRRLLLSIYPHLRVFFNDPDAGVLTHGIEARLRYRGGEALDRVLVDVLEIEVVLCGYLASCPIRILDGFLELDDVLARDTLFFVFRGS
jgi:hypothetical protein